MNNHYKLCEHTAMNNGLDSVVKATGVDEAFYKTLLESTKAIPWRIDWKTLCYTYCGPQIQELLGWDVGTWATVNEWVERMHPEDRIRVVDKCVELSKDGIDHEVDYRALRADGTYTWVREVVHVIRRDGETEALVGFVFDISERKKNEDELLRLKEELEVLSFQDALTEIANRRAYNLFLEREWEIAVRNQTSISAILLDVDFFKKFNDSYGHNAGDSALKTIAQVLKAEVRARDIAARFGGEEFVVILPALGKKDVAVIAERIRSRIEQTRIQYDGLEIPITASFGVGTIFPTESDDPVHFIAEIDKQLYVAKESGRNRVAIL